MKVYRHSENGKIICSGCWPSVPKPERYETLPGRTLSIWESLQGGHLLCDRCRPEETTSWREWQDAMPEPDPNWLYKTMRRLRTEQPDVGPFLDLLRAFYDVGLRTPCLWKYPGKEKLRGKGATATWDPHTRVGEFASKGDSIQYAPGSKSSHEGAVAFVDCFLSEGGPLSK